MTTEPDQPPRSTMTFVEYLVVSAIITGLMALVLPAVDSVRASQNKPPQFPSIGSLNEPCAWPWLIVIPQIIVAIVASVIQIVRWLLPRRLREFVTSTVISICKTREEEPTWGWRVAIVPLAVAGLATGLLLCTALHVSVDHTHRRPVVTWVGPLADHIELVGNCGLIFSVIPIIASACLRDRLRADVTYLAGCGVLLGYMNLFASLMFYAGVYED